MCFGPTAKTHFTRVREITPGSRVVFQSDRYPGIISLPRLDKSRAIGHVNIYIAITHVARWNVDFDAASFTSTVHIKFLYYLWFRTISLLLSFE